MRHPALAPDRHDGSAQRSEGQDAHRMIRAAISIDQRRADGHVSLASPHVVHHRAGQLRHAEEPGHPGHQGQGGHGGARPWPPVVSEAAAPHGSPTTTTRHGGHGREDRPVAVRADPATSSRATARPPPLSAAATGRIDREGVGQGGALAGGLAQGRLAAPLCVGNGHGERRGVASRCSGPRCPSSSMLRVR